MSRRILPIDGQWDGYRKFVRDHLSDDPSVSRGVLRNDLREWDAYDVYLQGHGVWAICLVGRPAVIPNALVGDVTAACGDSFAFDAGCVGDVNI